MNIKKKIIIGGVLCAVGLILSYKGMTSMTMAVEGGGSTVWFTLAIIALIPGGILGTWGLFEWQRKKEVDTMSEAIKKSKESQDQEE